jgi:hypothetical protein
MPSGSLNSLTTTYAGKYAGEYIRQAFIQNETLQHVTVKENIDYKQVVKKLVDTISFAAPTCEFDPPSPGTITITERVLTLEKFQVQRELCLNDFLTDWAAGDVQNGRLEPALVEAVIANSLAGISAKNETLVWQGVNANAGEYDGFITLLDNTVNYVSSPLAIVNGSTATTNANILVAIRNLIDECPVAVKSATEAPTIYMSYNCWEAYLSAQIASGNGWYATGGPEVPKLYMGRFPIAVCPGMPSSTMVMAQKSNLWFGTNLLNDWNSIQVVDMTQWAEDNIRFSAKFFAGAQIGFLPEVTAYGPGLS